MRQNSIKLYKIRRSGELLIEKIGADKVIEAANSLFEIAVTERQHKHQLTAQICWA